MLMHVTDWCVFSAMAGLKSGIQCDECPLPACEQPRNPANIQPVANNDVTDAEDQTARPSATGGY